MALEMWPCLRMVAKPREEQWGGFIQWVLTSYSISSIVRWRGLLTEDAGVNHSYLSFEYQSSRVGRLPLIPIPSDSVTIFISLGLRLIFSSYPQRRVALKLSYDGTGYHGWQKQPKIERTIQGELERHLSSLLKASIEIDGASRTDAGVHG